MKKCKITILKAMLFKDLCDEHMPANFGEFGEFEVCSILKEGSVFITGGIFGNSMPEGFCEYAWQAIQNMACTFAGGGKVFGQDFNIACCNDGLRPVIMKLETVDE